MSLWTHAICRKCYAEKQPGREPVRLTTEVRSLERCCFCGTPTFEGVYYRSNGTGLLCKGECDA